MRNADDRIHQAQKQGVTRHRQKVVPALGQGVHEIGQADAADGQMRQIELGAPMRMWACAMIVPP